MESSIRQNTTNLIREGEGNINMPYGMGQSEKHRISFSNKVIS
ncbi:hypothetical protein [Acidianus manzaensis]|nr:hypothetical protein [Acidianus manzaensis]